MKRILAALFIAAALFCGGKCALAGDINVCVLGKYLDFDVPPVQDRGKIMVPVRFVVEAAGGSIEYDKKTGLVTIRRQDRMVEFRTGSWLCSVNGSPVIMALPAVYEKDRVLVPTTFFDYAMGFNVYYDGIYREVIID